MLDCTVYFKKVSETYGQVSCEDWDTIIQLREAFSFFAPNYRFHPSFKNRLWDGKVRMLKESGEMYLGLWHDVKALCERLNIPVKIDPKISRAKLDKDKFNNYVDELNVHCGGDKIDPYGYQRDAAH